MKKLCLLLMIVFMTLLLSSCTSDTTSTNKAPATSSKELTLEQAEKLVKTWAEKHKSPKVSAIEVVKDPEKNIITIDEKTHYMFDVMGIDHPETIVSILVNPKTRELTSAHSGLPLDEWYQKSNNLPPDDEPSEVEQKSSVNNSTNKTSSDSRLAGRWAANNGARLEFSSNGIASTTLNIWQHPWNQKRDNMNWSTNNGRLSLTVSTQMNTSYSITKPNADGEVLTIDGKQKFKRKPGYGKTGDGVYGVWMPTDSGGNGIQFRNNNTGTNQFSHMGEFTWTDIGSGKLRIEYVRTQYFDYTIENGRLILFTNNGNIVFTKVGS